jgi:hypothetical protein
MKIQVKKISENSGFCREYYKNIENGNVYARQQEFKGVFKWYTTTSQGEPECHLREDIEIEVVGNWEEEQKKQEEEKSTYTSFQFRLLNELPTLFLVAIVLLAVVKDLLNFVFLFLGVLAFGLTLFFAAKAYKKFREK